MRRGLLVLAILLLAACTAEETPAAKETPTVAPSGAAARTAGDHSLKITVSNAERTFLLHAPTGYDPAKPMPAVIALHHRPGSAPAMRDLARLDAKADQEGFLVAYPEGVGGQFNAFGCCGVQDDVGFVKAVAGQLVTDWNADPDRVFLAGASNGGDLSFRAAVEASEAFAAIAAVSGGFYGSRAEAADYKPETPVSVLTFIGGADPMSSTLQAGVTTWQSRLGCSTAATTTGQPVRHTVARCADGSELDVYVIEGAGHVWFGATSGDLVDAAPKVVASDVLWAFFKAHPKAR